MPIFQSTRGKTALDHKKATSPRWTLWSLPGACCRKLELKPKFKRNIIHPYTGEWWCSFLGPRLSKKARRVIMKAIASWAILRTVGELHSLYGPISSLRTKVCFTKGLYNCRSLTKIVFSALAQSSYWFPFISNLFHLIELLIIP